jgi:hypothetical protein
MDENDMTEQEPAPANPVWARHLDAIADELVRLTAICDIDLRAPGVVDRVLRDDPSDCGKKNPIAFRKLRSLLAATYDSLNKAIGRIGADEVKAITSAIVARIDRHRAAGGQKPSSSSSRPFSKS